MKSFEAESYYDILRIHPDADLLEIKRAYRETRDIYQEDALATYSLFSDEQRSELLGQIDAAYHTLSDRKRRKAYDRELAETGHLSGTSGKPPMTFQDKPQSATDQSIRASDLSTWVKNRMKEEDIARMVEDVTEKDCVSGSDLKRLREAMDIKLSDVYEITRISQTTLSLIENNQFNRLPADVFLKSFLKTYAEILHLDSHRVIEGYYRNKALSQESAS
jgi:DnaJ-class molecular chaperone